MRHFISSLALLALLFIHISYSNTAPAFSKIEPALFNRITDTKESKVIPVIVQLEPFDGQAQLYEKIRAFPMPKRREEGPNLIKRCIEEYHQPILTQLRQQKEAEDIRSYWISNSISLEAPEGLIFALAERYDVETIVLNRTMKALPDPLNFQSSTKDALHNSSSAIAWGLTKIKANKVWELGCTGEGVIIAGIDTGVRYTHVDLASHMWTNSGEIPGNGIDDDGNGYVDDYYGYDFANRDPDPLDDDGHGTLIAGILAGDGTGGTSTGVAPNAQVMALKVMASGVVAMGHLQEGLQYAIDNDADVFSISVGYSYGVCGGDLATYNYVKNVFRPSFETLLTVGILGAVSAGNVGTHFGAPYNIIIPADPPPPWCGSGGHAAALAVGASNSSDVCESFSSRGPTEWDNSTYNDYPYNPGSGLIKPDLTAPGTSIKSCSHENNYSYITSGGTSAAAPFVAGAIALLLSQNPTLTPEQIDYILENTARDLGSPGKDNAYGAGRIQCSLAIAEVPMPSEPFVNYASHTIDDPPPGTNDNGILDPGETANIIVTLQNQGAAVENICVTLAEKTSSPYISITDDSSYYGSLTTLETKGNSTDPFTIVATPDMLPGTTIEFELTIYNDSGYSNTATFEIEAASYAKDLAAHENGYIETSVTNCGSIGFLDATAPEPSGKGFTINAFNYLCAGSFFLGVDYHNVLGASYSDGDEWQPASAIEIDSASTLTAQVKTCSFIAPKLSIMVRQTSYSFTDELHNDYLLLDYEIQNYSDSNYSELYCGVYCDWDIHYEDAWFDKAAFDLAAGIAYMYDFALPPSHPKYMGLAVIDSTDRGSIVDNPLYVYGGGMGWDDTVKYNFLSGKFYIQAGSTMKDWSTIVCKGPFELPAESKSKVLFSCAIVSGDDPLSLSENAEAARINHGSLQVVKAQHLVSHPLNQPSIFPNSPNPFITETSIKYYLPEPSDISIIITDLTGKALVTENIDKQPAGFHTFLWGGRDHNGVQLTTGVYLFSLKTCRSKKQIKMLMIR